MFPCIIGTLFNALWVQPRVAKGTKEPRPAEARLEDDFCLILRPLLKKPPVPGGQSTGSCKGRSWARRRRAGPAATADVQALPAVMGTAGDSAFYFPWLKAEGSIRWPTHHRRRKWIQLFFSQSSIFEPINLLFYQAAFRRILYFLVQTSFFSNR